MKTEVYIISGTMGSGKDAVLKRLKNEFDFYWVTSVTTRPMRVKEEEGKPYYFVNRREFNAMVNNKEFLEHSKIYGNFYGVTKKEINRAIKTRKKIFLRVNEDGIRTFKKVFPKAIRKLITCGCDYIVINRDVNETVKRVLKIVT